MSILSIALVAMLLVAAVMCSSSSNKHTSTIRSRRKERVARLRQNRFEARFGGAILDRVVFVQSLNGFTGALQLNDDGQLGELALDLSAFGNGGVQAVTCSNALSTSGRFWITLLAIADAAGNIKSNLFNTLATAAPGASVVSDITRRDSSVYAFVTSNDLGLVKYDIDTGDATVIGGHFGSNDTADYAIALSPGGNLYVLHDSELKVHSKANGFRSTVGPSLSYPQAFTAERTAGVDPLDTLLPRFSSLAFDSEHGELYGVVHTSGNPYDFPGDTTPHAYFVHIDIESGAVTVHKEVPATTVSVALCRGFKDSTSVEFGAELEFADPSSEEVVYNHLSSSSSDSTSHETKTHSTDVESGLLGVAEENGIFGADAPRANQEREKRSYTLLFDTVIV